MITNSMILLYILLMQLFVVYILSPENTFQHLSMVIDYFFSGCICTYIYLSLREGESHSLSSMTYLVEKTIYSH